VSYVDDYLGMAERGPDADLYRATLALERAFLGACMTARVVPGRDVGPHPDAFALEAHRRVFIAILAVDTAGEEPDATRVVFELARSGRLEDAGGARYVVSLLGSTDCSQIAVYARLVGEAARARALRRLTS